MSDTQTIIAAVFGLVALSLAIACIAGKWRSKPKSKILTTPVVGFQRGEVHACIGATKNNTSILEKIVEMLKKDNWLRAVDIAKELSMTGEAVFAVLNAHEPVFYKNAHGLWGLRTNPEVQKHMVNHHMKKLGEKKTVIGLDSLALKLRLSKEVVFKICEEDSNIARTTGICDGVLYEWWSPERKAENRRTIDAEKIHKAMGADSTTWPWMSAAVVSKQTGIPMNRVSEVLKLAKEYGFFQISHLFGSLTNKKVLEEAMPVILRGAEDWITAQNIVWRLTGPTTKYMVKNLEANVKELCYGNSKIASKVDRDGVALYALRENVVDSEKTRKIVQIREGSRVVHTIEESYDAAGNLISKETKAPSNSSVPQQEQEAEKFLIQELKHMRTLTSNGYKQRMYDTCIGLLEGKAVMMTAQQRRDAYDKTKVKDPYSLASSSFDVTKEKDNDDLRAEAYKRVMETKFISTPADADKVLGKKSPGDQAKKFVADVAKKDSKKNSKIERGDWVHWTTKAGKRSYRPSIVLDVHNGKAKVCYFTTKGKDKGKIKYTYKQLSQVQKTDTPNKFAWHSPEMTVDMAKTKQETYVKLLLDSQRAA